MTNEMTTARDVVEHYRIWGKITSGPDLTTDRRGWEHYAMTVRLNYNSPGRALLHRVEIPWRMGAGLDVGAFTGTDDSLPASSVAQVVWAIGQELPARQMDYPEFADEFDAWSERGYADWQSCRDLAKKVYDWCYSEEMAQALEHALDS